MVRGHRPSGRLGLSPSRRRRLAADPDEGGRGRRAVIDVMASVGMNLILARADRRKLIDRALEWGV